MAVDAPLITFDYSVGLTTIACLGDQVDTQQPLAVIHANDQQSWQQAADALRSAITLSDTAPQTTPMVYQRITAYSTDQQRQRFFAAIQSERNTGKY